MGTSTDSKQSLSSNLRTNMPNDLELPFRIGESYLETFKLTGNKRFLKVALVRLMEVYNGLDEKHTN